MNIRRLADGDTDAVWNILKPIIRAGETYALARELSRQEAFGFWCAPANTVFVAEIERDVLGTYYLRANHQGGGSHVANCGYMVRPDAAGRGIARALCLHSIEYARANGYRAMQFNCVVSTNERAIGLWTSLGFEAVGRLPGAFEHPRHGFVDAVVMYRHI